VSFRDLKRDSPRERCCERGADYFGALARPAHSRGVARRLAPKKSMNRVAENFPRRLLPREKLSVIRCERVAYAPFT
jgi:hypothetical protein